MKKKHKEIVVVGAGFGGLSAAIRLASAGHRVTLIDKRDKVGGRGYQYEMDGFKFDGGPTVITAPYMFDELFALGGRKKRTILIYYPWIHITEYSMSMGKLSTTIRILKRLRMK